MTPAPHDVLIAGDGVAGLTAGLFAARRGLSALVLAPGGPGGALMNTERIEDFPAFADGVAGFELGPLIQQQAAETGVDFEPAHATGVRRSGEDWVVSTDAGEREAHAVIVATGTHARALGVPGERELEGNGISHCAGCDGPLFRGRTVGVVGGGDSALLEALELVRHDVRVIVLDREATPRAQETYRRRVAEHDAISVRGGVAVEEVVGNGSVAAARVRELATGRVEDVELSGLFVQAGRAPNTAFLDGAVELDGEGRITTDARMRTPSAGLLAAGDVRADSAGQAVTCAGDGATAAITAYHYIKGGRAWD